MMVFFVILGVVVAVVRRARTRSCCRFSCSRCTGLMFVGMFCYHGFMLQWKGQTLGKMAMKIKVVTPEGGPITGPAVDPRARLVPAAGAPCVSPPLQPGS
jgi:uncharacterized RDD family membrane protein YckC